MHVSILYVTQEVWCTEVSRMPSQLWHNRLGTKLRQAWHGQVGLG